MLTERTIEWGITEHRRHVDREGVDEAAHAARVPDDPIEQRDGAGHAFVVHHPADPASQRSGSVLAEVVAVAEMHALQEQANLEFFELLLHGDGDGGAFLFLASHSMCPLATREATSVHPHA